MTEKNPEKYKKYHNYNTINLNVNNSCDLPKLDTENQINSGIKKYIGSDQKNNEIFCIPQFSERRNRNSTISFKSSEKKVSLEENKNFEPKSFQRKFSQPLKTNKLENYQNYNKKSIVNKNSSTTNEKKLNVNFIKRNSFVANNIILNSINKRFSKLENKNLKNFKKENKSVLSEVIEKEKELFLKCNKNNKINLTNENKERRLSHVVHSNQISKIVKKTLSRLNNKIPQNLNNSNEENKNNFIKEEIEKNIIIEKKESLNDSFTSDDPQDKSVISNSSRNSQNFNSNLEENKNYLGVDLSNLINEVITHKNNDKKKSLMIENIKKISLKEKEKILENIITNIKEE